MESEVPAGVTPGQLFGELGELLYASDEFGSTYEAVCRASRLLVVGCDHASVMVRDGKRLETVAATGEMARKVDALEREVGSGPCVDALLEESPQLVLNVASTDGPWPRLRRRVLAETPVRGMLGFRILHERRKVAALNLFSEREEGFSAEGVNHAMIMAAFCTVAMRAATARQQAMTLRQGLASNREIGKALGLMMAHHRVDDGDAFEILRTTSSQLNMKLAEVAAQIVDGHRVQLAD